MSEIKVQHGKKADKEAALNTINTMLDQLQNQWGSATATQRAEGLRQNQIKILKALRYIANRIT